ncbi:hypothetical protein HPB47_006275 [Ixodes persulcatus]|uniref:Uncharacterized protein n=1 Tax=Ixodes persulcatus TaxID=34615 RepID=A0AC60PAT0_IXOPE|nr:hypothetical protein HPB47_006275 [Ixodes persulcatus]
MAKSPAKPAPKAFGTLGTGRILEQVYDGSAAAYIWDLSTLRVRRCLIPVALSSMCSFFHRLVAGEMSNVLPKRERRRKVKPKLSFGSSSGACSSLPSNMQANLPELFELLKVQHGLAEGKPFRSETNGCSSEWSSRRAQRNADPEESRTPIKYMANGIKENGGFYAGLQEAIISSSSPPKDTSFALPNGLQRNAVGPKLAILTEADIADIVKKLREFLRDNGPTPETELWAELGAETSSSVRAQFGSLRTLLLRQRGFCQVEEVLDSFLYYEEEEEEDQDVPSRGPGPLAPPPAKAGRTVGAGSSRPGAKAGSLRAASFGSTGGTGSSTSYESADDEEPPRGRNVQTQTAAPRTSSRSMGSQTAPPTTADSYAQTEGFDPAWVEVLECRLKKRNQEITELQERLALMEEEHRAEMHKRIEKLQCRSQKLAEPEQPQKRQHCAPTTEREIHCLPIEPPDEPLVEPRVPQKPAERCPIPDFYELQLKMERQGSSDCGVDVVEQRRITLQDQGEFRLRRGPRESYQSRKWHFREQIKEHLKQFRESQGGLSNMKFNAIVAGVLALMKNSAPNRYKGDCQLCGARATLHHIVWECSRLDRKAQPLLKKIPNQESWEALLLCTDLKVQEQVVRLAEDAAGVQGILAVA